MLKIIDSSSDNLPSIATCHKLAFRHSLSSALGIPFLIKMLSWYLCNDHAFLFHLEFKGKIIGYCGGIIVDGTQSTGSASGMTQHSFNMAIIAFLKKPWLLFHPEVRNKYKLISRNILYKLKIKKPAKQNSKITLKEIMHVGLVVIGINPAFQGKGYSKMILGEFEQRAKNMGAKEVRLTVLSDNKTAIEAYKKNGWQEDKALSNSISMFKIINA